MVAMLTIASGASAENEFCSSAVDYLSAGQPAQARESYRQYVLELKAGSQADSRCDDGRFISRLQDDYIFYLDQSYVELCRLSLTQITPDRSAQLNYLTEKLASLGIGLSPLASKCRDNLSQQYLGLEWVSGQQPRFTELLNNCNQVSQILVKPYTEIRSGQAYNLLRLTQTSLVLEREVTAPVILGSEARSTYHQMLLDVESCLQKAAREFEVWRQTSMGAGNQ